MTAINKVALALALLSVSSVECGVGYGLFAPPNVPPYAAAYGAVAGGPFLGAPYLGAPYLGARGFFPAPVAAPAALLPAPYVAPAPPFPAPYGGVGVATPSAPLPPLFPAGRSVHAVAPGFFPAPVLG